MFFLFFLGQGYTFCGLPVVCRLQAYGQGRKWRFKGKGGKYHTLRTRPQGVCWLCAAKTSDSPRQIKTFRVQQTNANPPSLFPVRFLSPISDLVLSPSPLLTQNYAQDTPACSVACVVVSLRGVEKGLRFLFCLLLSEREKLCLSAWRADAHAGWAGQGRAGQGRVGKGKTDTHARMQADRYPVSKSYACLLGWLASYCGWLSGEVVCRPINSMMCFLVLPVVP